MKTLFARTLPLLLMFGMASSDPIAVSASESGTSGELINWQVISGGGGAASSASYRLSGTIGQAAPGLSSSTSFRVNAGFWQVFEGGSGSCCIGRVGDANGSNEPTDEVTLGDIMLMVDTKFISGDCSKLPCVAEADVNQDGGSAPTCDDHVTLGDIMTLVDFLFITGPDVAVLKTCL